MQLNNILAKMLDVTWGSHNTVSLRTTSAYTSSLTLCQDGIGPLRLVTLSQRYFKIYLDKAGETNSSSLSYAIGVRKKGLVIVVELIIHVVIVTVVTAVGVAAAAAVLLKIVVICKN